MENEIWKDIDGYKGLYQVSNYGNVRSLNYRHHGGVSILRKYKTTQGYLFVCLYKNKKKKNCYIHRLVGNAFLDNPNDFKEINHKDENKSNCNVNNLEWCSPKYNTNYTQTRHPEIFFTTINGKRTSKVTKYSLYEVKQYTLDGILIKTWNNVSEIVREKGYCHSSIVRCCLKPNQTAYGYKWEFADKNASSFFI